MNHLNPDLEQYIGGDIVNEIIEANHAKYGSHKRRFIPMDLCTDTLPAADLILCRDGLVHLSNEDVLAALKTISRIEGGYFLTTHFIDHRENRNIATGQWRPINLTAAPFNLAPPPRKFSETTYQII